MNRSNYWVPRVQEDLRRSDVILLDPFRWASSPKSKAIESKGLGRVRYLVDTVFGQLTNRCGLKRMWTRDLWHMRNRFVACFFDAYPGLPVQSTR